MKDRSNTLQARKQQLVQETIWDAAIEVFAQKGFDATTVEEIAEAAGVSRRSFFRYFASKDHLLGGGIIYFGQTLCDSVENAPPGLSPFGIMRHTVSAVAGCVAELPRSRKIIALGESSTAARQALRSRMPEAESMLAEAYLLRLGEASESHQMDARLLASLTFTLVDLALSTWTKCEGLDISEAVVLVEQTFTSLLAGSALPGS